MSKCHEHAPATAGDDFWGAPPWKPILHEVLVRSTDNDPENTAQWESIDVNVCAECGALYIPPRGGA